MQGSDLEAQVRAELKLIMPLVSALTGLPTHWSGVVELVPDALFLGQKRFSCDILIWQALANKPVRWRTFIHEALHAVSTGYNRTSFLEFPGWEEGVVESLQRLLRPEILAHLGVSIPEAVFTNAEISHPYNAYILALEKIRSALTVSEVQFYQRLLATPIAARPVSLLKQIRQLPNERQCDTLAIFSASNAILRTRL